MPFSLRFIPARAGNGFEGLRGDPLEFGSSPRVRGTVDLGTAAERLHRFIPARAGNGSSGRSRSTTTPVHPRACGERSGQMITLDGYNGSSPRVRGTD